MPEFEDLDPENLLAYHPRTVQVLSGNGESVLIQRRKKKKSDINGCASLLPANIPGNNEMKQMETMNINSSRNDFDEWLINESRNGSPAANVHGSVGLTLPRAVG
ncbi:hypothetical protein BJ742DRAFT_734464 [Cladochytrium replicatum]|nr:hypothetical protein BJ742DRAFT_734464 [Cladochytrium replicatum]